MDRLLLFPTVTSQGQREFALRKKVLFKNLFCTVIIKDYYEEN